MSGIALPRPQTLARYPQVLLDSRIEPLWDRIRRELKFPVDADIQFATYAQPSRMAEKNGKLVKMPESVVFLVVSPNPHPRYKGKQIKSFAISSIDDWRDAEKEAGHFVGVGDPAYPIFKELSRQHLAARKNMSELI